MSTRSVHQRIGLQLAEVVPCAYICSAYHSQVQHQAQASDSTPRTGWVYQPAKTSTLSTSLRTTGSWYTCMSSLLPDAHALRAIVEGRSAFAIPAGIRIRHLQRQ